MNGCGMWGEPMAKIGFKGIDEYAKRLGILWKEERGILEEAVYKGAEVVADEIKKGLQSIPTDEGIGTPENPITGVSKRQKADLINGFGLAPIENTDGYVNTKAGFDGYGSIKTKKYPKGQPITMLARSIESGTSFRNKTPVIRQATNRARKKAQGAMDQVVQEKIEGIMK